MTTINDCIKCEHGKWNPDFHCSKGLPQDMKGEANLKNHYRFFFPWQSNTPGYRSKCNKFKPKTQKTANYEITRVQSPVTPDGGKSEINHSGSLWYNTRSYFDTPQKESFDDTPTIRDAYHPLPAGSETQGHGKRVEPCQPCDSPSRLPQCQKPLLQFTSVPPECRSCLYRTWFASAGNADNVGT